MSDVPFSCSRVSLLLVSRCRRGEMGTKGLWWRGAHCARAQRRESGRAPGIRHEIAGTGIERMKRGGKKGQIGDRGSKNM